MLSEEHPAEDAVLIHQATAERFMTKGMSKSMQNTFRCAVALMRYYTGCMAL